MRLISATIQTTEPDLLPPVVLCTAQPTALWPPNHKMVDLQVNVSHQCESTPACEIIDVTSTDPDFEIEDFLLYGENEKKLQLRAERSGKDKEGRIYELTVECMGDEQKNWFNLEIGVPHDMGKMEVVDQDFVLNDSTKNNHRSDDALAGPRNDSSNKPENPPKGAKANNRPEKKEIDKVKKNGGNVAGKNESNRNK